jgi:hypothetical protein
VPESISLAGAAWAVASVLSVVSGWLIVRVYDNLVERVKTLETRVDAVEDRIEEKLNEVLASVRGFTIRDRDKG